MIQNKFQSTAHLIADAFKFTAFNLKELIKITFIPFVILFLFNSFKYDLFLLIYKTTPQKEVHLLIRTTLDFLFKCLVYAFWVPQWIQFSYNPQASLQYLKFDKRNWKFFGLFFAFALLSELWTIISNLISGIISTTFIIPHLNPLWAYPVYIYLISIVMIIVKARYSFKFIAVSLSQGMSFREVWKLTATFAFSLYALGMFTQLIRSMEYIIFNSFIYYGSQPLLFLKIWKPCWNIISWFMNAFYYCAVTKLYKKALEKH